VCHAHARDHPRVAKDGRRAGEVVEEANSGAKQHRGDVDVELVEEPGIQALLNGVGAVDRNGLPGGGGFGLAHGAFDAVGHEVDRRVGSRPAGGDLVGKDERRPPGVISAPALGDLEGAATGSTAPSSPQRARRCSALGPDTLNVMGSDPPVWNSTSPEATYQANTSATPSWRSAT
jgi:hypothetical protein